MKLSLSLSLIAEESPKGSKLASPIPLYKKAVNFYLVWKPEKQTPLLIHLIELNPISSLQIPKIPR